MENIFKTINDEELLEIYKDYLGSKELGIGIDSLKKYGKEIKEKYFINVDYSLGIGISLAEKMFFEEVAKRYFNTLSK
jgi:hypothetical protein